MPFVERMPVWSPDGTEIAFSHMFVGNAPSAIYRKRIGGGVEHKLVEADDSVDQIWPTDWSRDGKYLVYSTGSLISGEAADIHVLPLEGGEPFPLIATSENEAQARISPNGRWLAYGAGPDDTSEVYVVPFRPERDAASPATPAQKWQISVGGGLLPCWGADGKELFYISEEGDLVVVAVETEGESFSVGAATRLFETAFEPGKAYDVSPNGKNIAINEVSINVDTAISLILNWDAALNQ